MFVYDFDRFFVLIVCFKCRYELQIITSISPYDIQFKTYLLTYQPHWLWQFWASLIKKIRDLFGVVFGIKTNLKVKTNVFFVPVDTVSYTVQKPRGYQHIVQPPPNILHINRLMDGFRTKKCLVWRKEITQSSKNIQPPPPSEGKKEGTI